MSKEVDKHCSTCTWFRQGTGCGVCGHPKAYPDKKEYINFGFTCDKWEFEDFENMSNEEKIKKGYRYVQKERYWKCPAP